MSSLRDFLIPHSSIISMEIIFIGLQTRGLSLQCRIIECGCLIWSSTLLILRNKCLWDSPWLCITAVGLHFSLAPPSCFGPVLLSFVVAFFIQFSGVFKENYSICSCRFVLSIGGGEFRIFLLQPLEPLQWIFL